MLATLTSARLLGGGHPHASAGAATRSIVRTTIACSSRSLSAAQQLLAEVVVDRRVGAAARRAGERDRADALALAAHEQLRARSDEARPRRVPTQKQ